MKSGIAISLKEVCKSFKDTHALNGINLDVHEGELFGLIGPDGAGKTTLFRIIVTLMLPDSGSVNVFGMDSEKDFRELRKHIGYMPGRFSLYQDLTVEENLSFWATVFGTTIQKNYHLIKDIYQQLEPFKKRKAGQLSGGMKQKLALCCALIHHPRLLMLDEPTTGVDAVSRKEFWEMLQRLKGSDITIMVSTPYMDEADLCDRIALIQRGELMSVESPQNLKKSFTGRLIEIKSPQLFELKESINQQFNYQVAFLFGQSIHVNCQSEAHLSQLQNFLVKEGIQSSQVREIEPNTEDCFIQQMSDHVN
jgi:ABC-2 type transport system ATP-binding protein